MTKKAYFKVDTKLAELLGETYRSTEDAIKELVDNSYDADAEKVEITLPKEFTPNPEIIVVDDGTGMKEKEVRSEYLNVANSRTSRKGNLTFTKKRKVKGRKGIGKFSGLMVAEIMNIETCTKGIKTILTINRTELAKENYDLEKVPLPIETTECSSELHGTKITLAGLNQNFSFPNPKKLGQILMWDYGRENDFEIWINGEKLGIENLAGKSYERIIDIDGKKAILKYTVTPKPIKQSGIVTRVNNKIIGRPINVLSNDVIIPKKLKNRIFGELICDDLDEDVTADYGAVIENSKLFNSLMDTTTKEIKKSVDKVFATDMKMARARYQRKINKELSKLPEYKQPFAKKALHKVLEKFYGETEERINTVISVMVSAMEKDYYWDIISNIEETDSSDIEKFANALSEFGILEMSIVTSQAINRLRFLDELSILIQNPKTLEKDIHKVLENNTWILGDEFSVLFSDTNLKIAIEKVLDKKYKGKNKLKRPDLFLSRTTSHRLLLIEFKRPSFKLTRKTESQAQEYKDELSAYFGNNPIDIILLGGEIDQTIKDVKSDIKYLSYLDLISLAKNRLEWLLEELKKD
jgi:hypothetical protein